MKISKSTVLLASLALGLARNLSAAEAPKADAWGVTLPSSITEASLTTKVGWDSNVYCTEGAPLANQVNLVDKVAEAVADEDVDDLPQAPGDPVIFRQVQNAHLRLLLLT